MSVSFSKKKRMMRDHAAEIEFSSNGSGVSGFAQERAHKELVRKANTNGIVETTHAKLTERTRMSISHSENTLKALKKAGIIHVTYIYRYCEIRAKRIVCGTRVVLTEMRTWLKGALSKDSDLTANCAAELPYSDDEDSKPAKGIAMFRHYTWIDTETGEEKLSSKPELLKITGSPPKPDKFMVDYCAGLAT